MRVCICVHACVSTSKLYASVDVMKAMGNLYKARMNKILNTEYEMKKKAKKKTPEEENIQQSTRFYVIPI